MTLALVSLQDPDPLNLWQQYIRKFEDVSILSHWLLLGFLVLAAVCLVLMFVVKRKGWLALLVPLMLVFLGASVVTYFNLKYQYVQTIGQLFSVSKYDAGNANDIKDPTGSHPRGSVSPVTIPGTVSGLGDLPAMVYLPPQYYDHPDEKFPVLYLYHGVPDVPIPGQSDSEGPEGLFSATDVDGAALAAAKAGNPVVLVAPVVSHLDGDSECVDGAQGEWQTYLSVDVPAWVKSNPRFLTGAGNTGAGGYSMGGFCALVTSLRNPQAISVAGNLSGGTQPNYVGGNENLFNPGQNTAAQVLSYNAVAIVKTQPASRIVRVWQDVGGRDDPGLIASQAQFAQVAQAQGMSVVSNVEPGQQHTFTFWTQAFAEWIPWAADLLHKPLPANPGLGNSAPSPSGTSGSEAPLWSPSPTSSGSPWSPLPGPSQTASGPPWSPSPSGAAPSGPRSPASASASQ